MSGRPSRLRMRETALADLAALAGLTLRGEDRGVTGLDPVDAGDADPARSVTWATSPEFARRAAGRGFAAAVVADGVVVPDGLTALVAADGRPAEEAFFALLARTVEQGWWEELAGRVDDAAELAATAVVHHAVVVGPGCRVMDGAVLLPGTWLGADVVVKPGAVLGGDGLQIAGRDGRPRIVPHAGGVLVDDGATIGAQTCVDRGLFGGFTTVGRDTHVDNLVHVAHEVRIGAGAVVVACAEISGSVRIGDGAWLGPRSAINPSLTVGAHAFVGTGSTVVRDVPDHALVVGSPARRTGWRCVCRAPLDVHDGHALCARCGRDVTVDPDGG